MNLLHHPIESGLYEVTVPLTKTRIVKAVSHLGGTKKQPLLDKYIVSLDAILDAIDAINESWHGRDFCLWGAEIIEKAQSQHEARITSLRNVYAELEAITESIAD